MSPFRKLVDRRFRHNKLCAPVVKRLEKGSAHFFNKIMFIIKSPLWDWNSVVTITQSLQLWAVTNQPFGLKA